MSHSFSLSSHLRESFFCLTLLYFSSGRPVVVCIFAHVDKKIRLGIKILGVGEAVEGSHSLVHAP